MRKIIIRSILMLVAFTIMLSCQKEELQPVSGIVTDPDGEEYAFKSMNDGRIWLLENLNYGIKGYKSTWYDYDPANAEIYGRLYNFDAAKAACEALGNGWQLPTNEEWAALAYAYGGYGYHYGTRWGSEYGEHGDAKAANKALRKNGSSGFSALLGGMYAGGQYFCLNETGFYWSSTGTGRTANSVFVYKFRSGDRPLIRGIGRMNEWYSCRCVRDRDGEI